MVSTDIEIDGETLCLFHTYKSSLNSAAIIVVSGLRLHVGYRTKLEENA